MQLFAVYSPSTQRFKPVYGSDQMPALYSTRSHAQANIHKLYVDYKPAKDAKVVEVELKVVA